MQMKCICIVITSGLGFNILSVEDTLMFSVILGDNMEQVQNWMRMRGDDPNCDIIRYPDETGYGRDINDYGWIDGDLFIDAINLRIHSVEDARLIFKGIIAVSRYINVFVYTDMLGLIACADECYVLCDNDLLHAVVNPVWKGNFTVVEKEWEKDLPEYLKSIELEDIKEYL